MKIMIRPGEVLDVGFVDEEGFEVDGEFRILFDSEETPGEVRVEADLPDTSGRAGTIYSEVFDEERSQAARMNLKRSE